MKHHHPCACLLCKSGSRFSTVNAMGTPPCDNYPRGHPESRAHSVVLFRPWFQTSQIIYPNRNSEIGIEIEIETIPVQYGTSPSGQHSNPHCRVLSSTQQYGFSGPGPSCSNPTTFFVTEADSDDLALPPPFGRQLSPRTQRPRLHKDSRAQVQRLRRWGGRIRFRQLQTELHQKSRIRRQLPPSRRRPGR